MKPSRDVGRLIEIMAALRDPETGCPWDVEQDFASIAPYTIEEAHEVAEAIARNDLVDLREELGDLLLQVVYHARMAEEDGAFAFPDVVEAITTKMIRRHPHVFGDETARAAGTAKGFGKIKAEEKAERRAARAAAGMAEPDRASVLSGVGRGLPPLQRALKLQEKAGTVGFDWTDPRAVLASLRRGDRRGRGRTRRSRAREGADRRRDRRPDVRGGQPRPAYRDRSRTGAPRHEREVRAAVRGHRGRTGAPGAIARRRLARRDGGPLAGRQGARRTGLGARLRRDGLGCPLGSVTPRPRKGRIESGSPRRGARGPPRRSNRPRGPRG